MADHPFQAVAAADPSLKLIGGGEGKATRLRDRETGLWVLIASEDGSIFDRWAADEGAPFCRVDDETVARGTDAILQRIREARLTADQDRTEPGFRIISEPRERLEGDDT
ncbi:hypothetical protein SAMN05421538_107110 [Paracoccus isoporae]|uniref:Uncharacterized protein n=1 Tax=Paracoccus isoporae TaxID=591205 RepID=A0A1G7DK05_9RHOB|nr:hypothetical protein [Paracoccus isoporae]SDE51095.1 hypothetical protein SAMN05421538_107110 [Paracoccus isoporae]